MSRMLQQTRGGVHAVAFVARHYNKITTTRLIHNIKLVGLHNQLHQPAQETLRLHGLRLHCHANSTGGTAQVQKKVDVAFYKAVLQTIKLVHLHDSLHKPPVEKLSFRGLCLHDHQRYLQPRNDISLETVAEIISQSTFDSMKASIPSILYSIPRTMLTHIKQALQSDSIDTPEISVAYMKTSAQVTTTTTTTKDLAETPLMSTASLGDYIATLGQTMKSFMWGHNGDPKESLQLSQEPKPTTRERE